MQQSPLASCLFAFAVFVTCALIPTGALRALWLEHAAEEGVATAAAAQTAAIDQGQSAELAEKTASAAGAKATEALAAEFPASDVLYYGAFFVVLLAAITVPTLALWRATGRVLIDQVVPLKTPDSVTDEWHSARSNLEKLLHLDTTLLRNPLTAFSVLTPLVTSLIAAFIPEIKA